jgi:hypothetical protein
MSHDAIFYRTSFSKHLYSLARSGFFSHQLDADDRQFLEYVKRHGSANGNLPGSTAVLLEELEFWHLPYTTAPGIERRIGRRPRPGETEEQRALRQARSDELKARRIIRENEKAIAEAELQREHREWEKAQRNRAIRELISDAEWDAAAPAPFGTTIKRRYVPRWQLNEQGIAQWKADEQNKVRLLSVHARAAKKRKKLWRSWTRTLQERKKFRAEVLKRLRRQKLRQKAEQLRQKAEQQRREQIIAEARQTVVETRQLQRKWQNLPPTIYTTTDLLKEAIMTLLNSTPGQVWMPRSIIRALGCVDMGENAVLKCLEELVRDGRIRFLPGGQT